MEISACYAGVKDVYATLAGLPVLGWVAPRVESAAETLLSWTPLPLQHGPEEQVERSRVAVLDAMIHETLVHADVLLGTGKAESVKAYKYASATASDAAHNVLSATASIMKKADPYIPAAIKSLACATADGCKAALGNMANRVYGIFSWAASVVMSLVNAAIGFTCKTMQFVIGTMRKAGNAMYTLWFGLQRQEKLPSVVVEGAIDLEYIM